MFSSSALLSAWNRLGPAVATQRLKKQTVIVIVALVSVIVLILSTGGLLWTLRENDIEDAEESIKKLNVVLAHDTAKTIKAVDHLLLDIAKDILDRGITKTIALTQLLGFRDTHDDLRRRISGDGEIDAIALISATGDVINSTREFPVAPRSIIDQVHFRQMRDNPSVRFLINAPLKNSITGEWTVNVARRLAGSEGVFQGLVEATISLKKIEAYFREIDMGDSIGTGLWRDDATLLARFPPLSAMTGKANPGVLQNFERLLEGGKKTGTGFIIGGINPIPMLLNARRVPGYRLVTTVAIPMVVVTSTWRREAVLIIGGSLTLCLAIGVIAVLLRRQVRAQERALVLRVERDQATSALRAMEVIAKAKSDFLAHMSHELRTPLNAIIGFSEIMRGEMLGPIGMTQYKGYAGDIHNCGSNLLAIVNGILDFTNATAGTLRIKNEPIELVEAIQAVFGLLHGQTEKAELDFNVQLQDSLPKARADAQRLRQVLINLTANAIKFTPPGGRVRIAAQNHGDYVRVTVEDTGEGMPPELLASIFQPFSRATQSYVADEKRGTGLGLPFSKQLVELMGGTLKLESTLGQGTIATITLPSIDLVQSDIIQVAA